MDTNTIRYIIEIVNLGSINKAAQKLYMNHQNLGKKVSQVEEELGVKLLKRTKTGVVLTEEGQVIYEKLLQIDEISREIKNYVNLLKRSDECLSEENQKLTVYLNSSIFPKKASAAILNIEQQFPGTEIVIEESYYKKVLDQIYSQENVFANVVVSKEEYQKIPSDIMVFYKKEYDLSAYIPKSLFSTGNIPTTLDIKDFIQMPIVLYSAYDIKENIIWQILNKYGNPNIKHITMNYVNFCDIMYKKKYATLGWHKNFTKYYEGDGFSEFMLNGDELEIVPLTYKKKRISAISLWLCRKDTNLLEEVKYLISAL